MDNRKIMVLVRVNEGLLEGEVIKNKYGGSFCSFKGIPYADPPVGELRFKAPQPKKSWTRVRKATEFGPRSPQFDGLLKQVIVGDEDCLYLNVYTPEVKPASPLPVMFWIHGGGFIWGSGNDDMYGPEFLVRQGVVLVTINYRLEVLGFLCLNTADVPGNAGMKDQVAALRWVSKNIHSFGGDPKNVTIFGESAGGASTSFHLISPMSKGYFKRVIVQSGSATAWWCHESNPRDRAEALAKKLGCDSRDDKELYEFYKAQPAQKFIGSIVPMTIADETLVTADLNFTVVDEKKFGDNERFFYGSAYDAFRNGVHEGVEVITGYVEHEGLILFGMNNQIDAAIHQANTYLEYFVPRPIALNYPRAKQFEAAKRVREFYLGDEKVTRDNFMKLNNYVSADLMKYEILNAVRLIDGTKNKRYFYVFTAKSKRNLFKEIFGLEPLLGDKQVVAHCDDLAYLFPINIRPQEIDVNSKEFQLIERVTKLWTNFAKYGDPTPDTSLGVTWQQYSTQQPHYLDIGEELAPKTSPDKEEIEFWDQLYRDYPCY